MVNYYPKYSHVTKGPLKINEYVMKNYLIDLYYVLHRTNLVFSKILYCMYVCSKFSGSIIEK